MQFELKSLTLEQETNCCCGEGGGANQTRCTFCFWAASSFDLHLFYKKDDLVSYMLGFNFNEINCASRPEVKNWMPLLRR